jgi:hypothetical protein
MGRKNMRNLESIQQIEKKKMKTKEKVNVKTLELITKNKELKRRLVEWTTL